MTATILVASSRPDDVERLAAAVDDRFRVVAVAPAAVAGAALVCASVDQAPAVLAHLPVDGAPPLLILGDPSGVPDDPRVTHVVRRKLPDGELRALVISLAAGVPWGAPASEAPTSPDEARVAQRAFAASRRLAAAQDLAATERACADAIVELVEADRVVCLFHDPGDGSLWSEAKLSTEGDARRAIAGLAGFAARTGAPVCVPRAADDPRWFATVDDPAGDASARLLVQPILGADRHVHAVVVALRGARRGPFGDVEAALLGRFAELATPFLDQLSIHVQAQALLEARDDGLFRKEALEAQALPPWGDVIRVSPPWISWAYWGLVVLLAASIAYVSLGTVATYSTGPAIVRSTTRTEVTARSPGNVTAVEVAPGDAIAPGDVIARLDDADARGTVDRLSAEFETQLRNHMLDASDAGADAALRSLRLELDRARLGLEERLIRAPVAGVVGDVRVRSGSRLEPGDIAATIVDGSGELEVIALLPGSDRPQLAPGMPLRLELTGYRYAYQTVTIDAVSADVIAPGEAVRVLGAEVAGGLQLGGPVVLVRARLPAREFEVDGDRYRYHDGMVGQAEIRVRQERILFTLVPGLRKL